MTMPAGTYYVGDLCYVLCEDRDWSSVCESMFSSEYGNPTPGEYTLPDGRRYAIQGTAHGDGSYMDTINGGGYPVDSGTIGCILVSDLTDTDHPSFWIDGGNIIEFDAPFNVYASNGVIHFGNKVAIDTDPTDNFDDEEGF